MAIDEAVRTYYEQGMEDDRLLRGAGVLEFARTRELLHRYLPPPPAAVLDVGGASGIHAGWLAADGYRVHLVDAMALHVEQAQARAARQPERPFTAALGDARGLLEADASYDAVLLLGPLYHLTERADRLAALREARRVVRPGGFVCAAAISRFASLLDGIRRDSLIDPEFRTIVEQDLHDGQHRNPRPEAHPGWFTTAYFHHPDELAGEIADAGLRLEALLGIEGPGWLGPVEWSDVAQRQALLFAARAVEAEPTLLGLSPHLLAVARA